MVAVANPLSQEHSHLRTLLLPSLLEALRAQRGLGPRRSRAVRDRARLPPATGEQLPREPWTFGAVMRGRLGGAAWRRAGEPASFFLGKGVLESILGAVGVTCRVVAMPTGHDPFLHPGPQGLRAGARRAGARLRGRAPPADGAALRLRRCRSCASSSTSTGCASGCGDPPTRAAAVGVPAAAAGHRGRRLRRASRERGAGGRAHGGRRAAQRRAGLRRLARCRGARRRPAVARAAADVPGTGPDALRRGGAPVPARPSSQQLREAVGAELRGCFWLPGHAGR